MALSGNKWKFTSISALYWLCGNQRPPPRNGKIIQEVLHFFGGESEKIIFLLFGEMFFKALLYLFAVVVVCYVCCVSCPELHDRVVAI